MIFVVMPVWGVHIPPALERSLLEGSLVTAVETFYLRKNEEKQRLAAVYP